MTIFATHMSSTWTPSCAPRRSVSPAAALTELSQLLQLASLRQARYAPRPCRSQRALPDALLLPSAAASCRSWQTIADVGTACPAWPGELRTPCNSLLTWQDVAIHT